MCDLIVLWVISPAHSADLSALGATREALGWEGESASRVIEIVGRTQFRVVVGLKCISLLAVGEGSFSASKDHLHSLSSKPATVSQVLLRPHFSCLLFCCLPPTLPHSSQLLSLPAAGKGSQL